MESGCWTSLDWISSTADGLGEQLKLASFIRRGRWCVPRLTGNFGRHTNRQTSTTTWAVRFLRLLFLMAGANYIWAAQLVKCRRLHAPALLMCLVWNNLHVTHHQLFDSTAQDFDGITIGQKCQEFHETIPESECKWATAARHWNGRNRLDSVSFFLLPV